MGLLSRWRRFVSLLVRRGAAAIREKRVPALADWTDVCTDLWRELLWKVNSPARGPFDQAAFDASYRNWCRARQSKSRPSVPEAGSCSLRLTVFAAVESLQQLEWLLT